MEVTATRALDCSGAAPAAPAAIDGGVIEPSAVVAGRIEPGGQGGEPVLVVDGRRIPWSLVGETLVDEGGVYLTLTIGAGIAAVRPGNGTSRRPQTHSGQTPPSGDHTSVGRQAAAGDQMPPGGGALVGDKMPPGGGALAAAPCRPPDLGPRPPLRAATDEFEAESWAEAVSLLDECLSPETRHPCPVDALVAACAAARAGVQAVSPIWHLVAEAAGWLEGPPIDDIDLWTGAAMAIISVAVEDMDADSALCLDAMELDDWLATILELVRAGPGTVADPPSLLALAARCFDVDSAALDADQAPVLMTAFSVMVPVWTALGVLDAALALTPLGAWGLPLASARAWGGWLHPS